jgi:hypothetical protein
VPRTVAARDKPLEYEEAGADALTFSSGIVSRFGSSMGCAIAESAMKSNDHAPGHTEHSSGVRHRPTVVSHKYPVLQSPSLVQVRPHAGGS